MRRKRLVSGVAGLAVVAALLGATAPAGIAQDPGYLPEAPTTVVPPPPGSGPAPVGSPERALQLKRCIAKAKAKFGDNKVKKKAAIKKCKKKYG